MLFCYFFSFFFFKQKPAYELRISDWSSDVCSSDLEPKVTAQLPLTDARASAIQFRYLWVTDAEGVKLFDVTHLAQPVAVPSGKVRLANARKLYLARTYMYVAAKADGLVIVDVTPPPAPDVWPGLTFGGALNDSEDVIFASTNASLFGFGSDGRNGIKLLQPT